MKKLLSIFLATAMLISLIPAVFAADTEAEAGIKVVYDFYSAKLAEASGTNAIPIENLSYSASNGFWQYADCWDHRTSIKTTGGGFRAESGYIKVIATKEDASTKYWVAFKLNVPKKGKYEVAIEAKAWNYPTDMWPTAYIFKAVSDGGIEAEMIPENKMENSEKRFSASNSYETHVIGSEDFVAGEYYFVFKPSTDKTGTFMFLKSLTLTENGTGTKSVPMISSLTATPNEDGTTTVAAEAKKMSDATTDATDVTYSYSVADDDTSLASVDAKTGVVTGLADGTATIIATATASEAKGGLSSSKSIEVEVTAPVTEPEEDPIPEEEFDAVEDKTAITSYNIGDVTAVAYTVGDAEENSISVSATPNTDGTYTLNAPACEGYNFLYWKKGLTEKKDVITYKPTGFVYAPTAGENNIVIAVYEKVGETTTAKAEFYNANGQFIKATDGAFPEEKEIPSMAGYGDATGWQCYTDGKTYALTDSVTPDGIMLFVADYKDTLDMVKVNGTDVPYGTEMSFTAKPETGKTFKCWTRTDEDKNTEIVSIEETYKFRAYENCTIKEVDTDKTVVLPTNKRKIVLDTFSVGSATALMAEFIGFKNDTVVEKGIMLGNNRIAMKSTGTQFTIIPDETGTYEGYAIVKDGTDYTLITDGSYPATAE